MNKLWKKYQITKALNNWQNTELSLFCFKNCEGNCCRKPYNRVLMTKKQIQTILKIPDNDALIADSKEKSLGRKLYWVMTHRSSEHPHCPGYNIQNKHCHLQKNKPKICRSFPITVMDDNVRLHSECLLAQKTSAPAIKKLVNICKKYNYKLHVGQ